MTNLRSCAQSAVISEQLMSENIQVLVAMKRKIDREAERMKACHLRGTIAEDLNDLFHLAVTTPAD